MIVVGVIVIVVVVVAVVVVVVVRQCEGLRRDRVAVLVDDLALGDQPLQRLALRDVRAYRRELSAAPQLLGGVLDGDVGVPDEVDDLLLERSATERSARSTLTASSAASRSSSVKDSGSRPVICR